MRGASQQHMVYVLIPPLHPLFALLPLGIFRFWPNFIDTVVVVVVAVFFGRPICSFPCTLIATFQVASLPPGLMADHTSSLGFVLFRPRYLFLYFIFCFNVGIFFRFFPRLPNPHALTHTGPLAHTHTHTHNTLARSLGLKLSSRVALRQLVTSSRSRAGAPCSLLWSYFSRIN